MSTEALKRACEVAGGQKPLADRIGTTQSQVWYWLTQIQARRARRVRAAKIEEATGVPRSELRPDLWPTEVVRA
jgi:DNA-binding transcriptional regulator YdaS (Cro superfamily)